MTTVINLSGRVGSTPAISSSRVVADAHNAVALGIVFTIIAVLGVFIVYGLVSQLREARLQAFSEPAYWVLMAVALVVVPLVSFAIGASFGKSMLFGGIAVGAIAIWLAFKTLP